MTGAQEAMTALAMLREQPLPASFPWDCPHPAEALERREQECVWICGECWAAVPDENVVERMEAEALR